VCVCVCVCVGTYGDSGSDVLRCAWRWQRLYIEV
jgi:hypothetical protein